MIAEQTTESRIKTHFPIESMCSDVDKISLLLIQDAVIWLLKEYAYFEIGSYKGGSIYPHLVNGACSKIYSLDRRDLVSSDGEGSAVVTLGNKGINMARHLSLYANESDMNKLEILEGSSFSPGQWHRGIKANLFFLDGEKSSIQATQDFLICRMCSEARSVYVFQKASLLPAVLRAAIKDICALTEDVCAYPLPGDLFVIEKNLPIHRYGPLGSHQIEYGHLPYLNALEKQDVYREFYCRPIFVWLRGLWTTLRGKNWFKM